LLRNKLCSFRTVRSVDTPSDGKEEAYLLYNLILKFPLSHENFGKSPVHHRSEE